MYDNLEANIPHHYMGFQSIPFPEATPLLPHHSKVSAYLDEAARSFEPFYHLESQVISLLPPSSPSNSSLRWELTHVHLPTDTKISTSYDAIAICTGHYYVPHIPSFPGLETWNLAYPGTITHSKSYRCPKPFAGKKVLVIGASVSGIDISTAIASVTPHRVLVSRHTGELRPPSATKVEVPAIDAFLPPTPETSRAIRFSNGHIECDIDAVVWCTGYLYSFPFLPADLQERLVSDGSCVSELYQHLFWQKDPSLVFIGLLRRVLPIPVSEAQAAVVARVWSERLPMPTIAKMVDWEQDRVEKCGKGRAFHLLAEGEDLLYCEELGRWSERAMGEDQARGLQARKWTAKDHWLRRKMPAIKMTWIGKGSEKYGLTTIEDMGLQYEAIVEKKATESQAEVILEESKRSSPDTVDMEVQGKRIDEVSNPIQVKS